MIGRIIITTIIIIVLLILVAAGFKDVHDGYMAVEVCKIGKHRILPQPLPAGWYWRRPFMVYFVLYNMRERISDLSTVEVLTKDKKKLSINSEVYYQLQEQKLVDLHKRFGNDYKIDRIIHAQARSCLERILKNFLREEAFGAKRADMKKMVLAELRQEFDSAGIAIRDFLIQSISFPDKYTERLKQYFPSMMTALSFSQECLSKNKSRLFIDGAIYFYIEPQHAEYVYEKLGTNYAKTFLVHQVKAVVHAVSSNYSPDEIFQDKSRKQVVQEIIDRLRSRLQPYQIKIGEATIQAVRFPQQYQEKLDAIELNVKEIQKIQAELDKEKELAKLTRFKNQEKGDAEVLRAKSDKDARLIQAQGIRDAAILEAEGKAASLQKIQKIITENPKLMQYLFIDKISNNVKVIVVPAKNGNLLLESAMKTATEK